MKITVDVIIVGQGLAGSALAWELLQRGRRVMVFDEPDMNRASKISAGICNPITGKVMGKTYLAEKLFPFLNAFYPAAEKTLHRSFFHPLPLYRPFFSLVEQQEWMVRAVAPEIQPFVSEVRDSPLLPGMMNNPFGGLVISQSGYLDVDGWVSAVREALMEQEACRVEHFDEQQLEIGDTITYRDLLASRIVFCNGLSATKSKWFGWLPLRALKGETITVRMAFDKSRIISRGVYIVPGRQDNTWIVGSTYQHIPFEEQPTEEAQTQLTGRLTKLISVPFEVVHQDWGIRPTVTDRRPLIGHHPAHGNVIIFNGMGTKGVSLTPYFAKMLVDEMDNGPSLPGEVNILRFKSLYSK